MLISLVCENTILFVFNFFLLMRVSCTAQSQNHIPFYLLVTCIMVYSLILQKIVEFWGTEGLTVWENWIGIEEV